MKLDHDAIKDYAAAIAYVLFATGLMVGGPVLAKLLGAV